MKISISNKKENVLLKRTELELDIEHFGEPTPKRDEVRKALATQLKVDEAQLAIRKLKSTYGTTTKCLAFLYKTREDLEQLEPKHILGREKSKEKAEEKPKEAPKEEAKPEEKKEEAKPKEKKEGE